jgi:hypothetical protein
VGCSVLPVCRPEIVGNECSDGMRCDDAQRCDASDSLSVNQQRQERAVHQPTQRLSSEEASFPSQLDFRPSSTQSQKMRPEQGRMSQASSYVPSKILALAFKKNLVCAVRAHYNMPISEEKKGCAPSTTPHRICKVAGRDWLTAHRSPNPKRFVPILETASGLGCYE